MKKDAYSCRSQVSGLRSLHASARWWLLAALLLLPLMITNDSLWLDEGDTAMYAVQPDFHAWTERLRHDGQADCQMPLAMLSAWVAGKLWGTQEWQLRAVNVLWGALALAAMSRVGRRLQLPWLPLLLAIQPYFWFYQNEARPYALQLAGGAWLLAALVDFYAHQAGGTGWAWELAVTAFLLCCATMLAPLPLAATVLAGSFLLWRHNWRVERKALWILAGGLMACLPVGVYYVSTLLRGVKGSQMWHVDLKFVLYVFYELTGMGGMGLSSQEIRGLARSPHLVHELTARLPQLILPLLMGALLLVVLCVGLWRQGRGDRRGLLIAILLVPLATAMVFIAASLGLQKAFWARHYAPVFPFLVALLGLAFAGLKPGKPRWLGALPLGLGGLLAWSSFNCRFAPALRKEDYRSAANFVRPCVAAGQSVWWAAGGFCARYYGLDVTNTVPRRGQVFGVFLSGRDVRTLPLPEVIVMSRPDVHDASGAVRDLIVSHRYAVAARYQGFVIWTNAPSEPGNSNASKPKAGA